MIYVYYDNVRNNLCDIIDDGIFSPQSMQDMLDYISHVQSVSIDGVHLKRVYKKLTGFLRYQDFVPEGQVFYGDIAKTLLHAILLSAQREFEPIIYL